MSDVGKPERVTQNRVVALFRDELDYDYLGNWEAHASNSNIEDTLLSRWLTKSGYSPFQVSAAIHSLRAEANHPTRGLYANNEAVYKRLRYGIGIKAGVDENTETVQLIDWKHPEKNHFAIAEEVTLKGNLERRPDIVIYVNGIAIGVLELKKSSVDIGEGIRQSLSNQKPEYHEWFFSTVQFVLAGNDTEGLKYGTIGTPQKFFNSWKEDVLENSGFKLDKYIRKVFNKERLIDLMHDFVLFDGGEKKLPRVHQYFGIKAAQQCVAQRLGGIIWHTQGSGKSIVMVLLAKWILENYPQARIAIVTDRDELDKQIERVFIAAGEKVKRARSGSELMRQLSQPSPRIVCSLVQKFGNKGEKKFDEFIKEIEENPVPTFGEIFVFVDECHRTQSGKLHRIMTTILSDAVLIGFTGTPLMKKDSTSTLETFGRYIHTYKFNEAVEDKVILDLAYDPRDIDQRLGSKEKIDTWFDVRTKVLKNEWQKNELKKYWATMQNVLSSKARIERIVADIIFDFEANRRLSDGKGNAILVASSIYEACKYYLAFSTSPLKKKVAIITSYDPHQKDVKLEDTGENKETDKKFIYDTYVELLKTVQAATGKTKTETYEDNAKQLFIEQPANMKLLIVVNKLLTGFDAPPCSVLYIDRSMKDHGLFQAICRTNRLDTEDKLAGTIVDYKDLFKEVKGALSVYTSELDNSSGVASSEVLLQDRVKKGRERLENALETLELICEPVEPPKGELEHIHYFCGNTEISSDLAAREQFRVALYKATVALVRAMADLAEDMEEAGFGPADVAHFEAKRAHYLHVREIVRKASGETLDLKPFEADMRHLLDTYIEADEARKLSPFENMTLLQIMEKVGIQNAIKEQLKSLKGNETAIAETIENNVRKVLIEQRLLDPVYFDTMSDLLQEIIKQRKAKAEDYEQYLKRIAQLVRKIEVGHSEETPSKLDTSGKRALWNNLGRDEDLALKVDAAVRNSRPDAWRGVFPREQTIKGALFDVLLDEAEVERIFPILVAQDEY